MADEKKEEKKSYTFLDKRGVDHDEPAPQKDLKGSGAERKPEPQPSPDPGPTESQTRRGVPLSIDFTTLIMSFASAAMISMGRVEDPATGAVQKNLAVAQQNIDIITGALYGKDTAPVYHKIMGGNWLRVFKEAVES